LGTKEVRVSFNTGPFRDTEGGVITWGMGEGLQQEAKEVREGQRLSGEGLDKGT
jgi:hypothetical protein